MKVRRILFRGFQAWVVVTVLVGAVAEVAVFFVFARAYFSPPRIFPNVTINGKPAHLMLDTGSGETLLTESGARRLGIKFSPPSPSFTFQWLNRTIPLGLSEPVSLTVGKEAITVQLPVGDFPGLETDGYIGWAAVRDNILVFDGTRRTVYSVENLPAETAGWTKLGVLPGSNLFLVVPTLDGKAGTILVDTGEPGGIKLPPSKWKEFRAAHPWDFTADEIKLGELTFSDVRVDEPYGDGFTLGNNYLGTLGVPALERMDLIVDGKNGFAYVHSKPPTGLAAWTVDDNVQLQSNELFSFLATYKVATHDLDGAIADYTRAIELDPKNIANFINRAAAKMSKHDYDGAVADYDRVLELDPQDTMAKTNRDKAKNHEEP